MRMISARRWWGLSLARPLAHSAATSVMASAQASSTLRFGCGWGFCGGLWRGLCRLGCGAALAGSAQRVGIAAQAQFGGDCDLRRGGQAQAVECGHGEADDLGGRGERRAWRAGGDRLLRGATGEGGVDQAGGQHQRREEAEG